MPTYYFHPGPYGPHFGITVNNRLTPRTGSSLSRMGRNDVFALETEIKAQLGHMDGHLPVSETVRNLTVEVIEDHELRLIGEIPVTDPVDLRPHEIFDVLTGNIILDTMYIDPELLPMRKDQLLLKLLQSVSYSNTGRLIHCGIAKYDTEGTSIDDHHWWNLALADHIRFIKTDSEAPDPCPPMRRIMAHIADAAGWENLYSSFFRNDGNAFERSVNDAIGSGMFNVIGTFVHNWFDLHEPVAKKMLDDIAEQGIR